MTIHRPADVHKSVLLGRGAVIWPFSSVLEGTIIGPGSVIGTSCWVGKGCKIGGNVRLNHGCFLPHLAVLEDDVFLGPGVILTDDKQPRAGNKNYHAQPPRICKGASLGAGVLVLPGVTIGEGAMIGAGAVVTKDVPPGLVVVGLPARVAA